MTELVVTSMTPIIVDTAYIVATFVLWQQFVVVEIVTSTNVVAGIVVVDAVDAVVDAVVVDAEET
jgi:hypothetical protein